MSHSSTKRIYNFAPGPGVLPEPVLRKAADEFLSYQGRGFSIVEASHRSKAIDELIRETQSRFRKHLKLDADTHILFLQGGATTEFFRIPYNFIHGEEETIEFIQTGSWTKKALKTAKHFAKVHNAASSEEQKFTFIPSTTETSFNPESRYVYICSNNTIYGTQYQDYPDTNGVPLVADMTSDIFSREVDYNRFDAFFASPTKNMGPAGATALFIKDKFLQTSRTDVPEIYSYRENLKANSIYNTSPIFTLYMINEMLKWMDEEGGTAVLEARNRKKAAMIYECIETYPNFYHSPVKKSDRSICNVPWTLSVETLTDKFVADAEAQDLFDLKGHREVGGLRASIYNAMSLEGVEKLVDFMNQFAKTHA